MTTQILINAIARSIAHDEIVSVALSDCLDRATAAEINIAANEYDRQAYRDMVRDVIGTVIGDAQNDHDHVDAVENGAVWEMWGTADGGDYRVHIRISQ